MNIKRYYNTITLDKEHLTKHVPPANKEWKNSVYSYNKTLLKDTALRDENTYDTMKSYINSNFIGKKRKNLKSMRMRSYIKRSSTKRVFISKPDIKQTTNKAIVTLYIFDRENQLLKPNSFTLNRFLKKKNSIFSKTTSLKEKLSFKNPQIKLKNNHLNEYLKKTYASKKYVNRFKINYNLFSKNIAGPMVSKQSLLKDLFIYSFLTWMLQKNFGVVINTYKYCNNCNTENIITTNTIEFCKNCGKGYRNNYAKLRMTKDYKELLFINKFNFKDIKNINLVLSKYLNNFLSKIVYNEKYEIVNKLFYKFMDIKNIFFFKKVLKKENNIMSIYTKLNYSNFKYTALLSHIKNYISNIYLKNIELNLVNLKYLHLNSDIFMEALAIKLRKKKLSLLRVLKKSLFLVKRPSKFSGMLEKENPLYNKNLSFTLNKDNFLLKNKNFTLNLFSFSTIENILNSLKYKWISGIRLEAKGRLTKRYTASRAVFKYITRGNLRNLDKLYNRDFDSATPNVYLIRNQFKPNLQHTYVYSNKRIGTFGLKGWISSV